MSLIVGCGALAACSPIAVTSENSAEFSDTTKLFPYSDADSERLRKELDKPLQSTIALELGPKLVELKASYTEQRSKDDAKNSTANL
ncbi:MAG TPA: hypothetical protein VGA27_06505, partial [Candidatus Binatia bacterium]